MLYYIPLIGSYNMLSYITVIHDGHSSTWIIVQYSNPLRMLESIRNLITVERHITPILSHENLHANHAIHQLVKTHLFVMCDKDSEGHRVWSERLIRHAIRRTHLRGGDYHVQIRWFLIDRSEIVVAR